MTENPFEPPGIPQEAEPAIRPDYFGAGDGPGPDRRKRPLLVMLICPFYFGMGLLTSYFLYEYVTDPIQYPFGPLSPDWIPLLMEFGIPIGLMLAGSVGLWRGRPWGFFLLGFFVAYRLVETAQPVALAAMLWLPNLNTVIAWLSLSILVMQVVVRGFVLYFLFSPPVMVFCGLEVPRRLHFALLLFGLAVAWHIAKPFAYL